MEGKKILLFEPWHLGDVAVALSVCKPLLQPGVEFALVCNRKWKEWALSTGVVKEVICFTPPWTFREQKDKYNPFHYRTREFLQFRKEVLQYNPDLIVDLRSDIRARAALKIMFGRRYPIKSSYLPPTENVYQRGGVIKKELQSVLIAPEMQALTHETEGIVTLFFAASDTNRMMPLAAAVPLLQCLHEKGFQLNLILQPADDRQEYEQLRERFSLHRLHLLQGCITTLAAAVKKSEVVVSTDSGWLHVAHFYRRPTIGLFAFDTMKTWLPPGSSFVKSAELYPDHFRYKKRYRSLQPLLHVDIEEVVKLVLDLRARHRMHAINTL